MRKKFYIFFLLGISSCQQKNNYKERDGLEYKVNNFVLSENAPNREYFFKIGLDSIVLEYRIKLLGTIEIYKQGPIKFLAHTVFTGLYEDSKRASSVLYLYDIHNEIIGYYPLGGATDVP